MDTSIERGVKHDIVCVYHTFRKSYIFSNIALGAYPRQRFQI